MARPGDEEGTLLEQDATVDAAPSKPEPSVGVSPPKQKRSMSASKILLIVAGLACAGLLFWGVVAGIWVYFNGRDFVDDTQAVMDEGREAGTELSADACVDEGVKRADACAGWNLKCRVREQLFLTGCLKTAHSGFEMCGDVPAAGDIMDSITFRKRECSERGQAGEQSCQQLMQAVQMHCDELRKSRSAH